MDSSKDVNEPGVWESFVALKSFADSIAEKSNIDVVDVDSLLKDSMKHFSSLCLVRREIHRLSHHPSEIEENDSFDLLPAIDTISQLKYQAQRCEDSLRREMQHKQQRNIPMIDEITLDNADTTRNHKEVMQSLFQKIEDSNSLKLTERKLKERLEEEKKRNARLEKTIKEFQHHRSSLDSVIKPLDMFFNIKSEVIETTNNNSQDAPLSDRHSPYSLETPLYLLYSQLLLLKHLDGTKDEFGPSLETTMNHSKKNKKRKLYDVISIKPLVPRGHEYDCRTYIELVFRYLCHLKILSVEIVESCPSTQATEKLDKTLENWKANDSGLEAPHYAYQYAIEDPELKFSLPQRQRAFRWLQNLGGIILPSISDISTQRNNTEHETEEETEQEMEADTDTLCLSGINTFRTLRRLLIDDSESIN